jgi:hypothetical protein
MHSSAEHLAPVDMGSQNRVETFRYSVYGISLRSEIPLPLPEHTDNALAEIELRTASADWFAHATRGAEITGASTSWYQYSTLQDRSIYARWKNVGNFLVSNDGRTIACRQFEQAAAESFSVYLLGQALSFALVKQGLEPLHATTVVVNGEAVVFLGSGGFGKSTLAACFLAAGHRILTDDLLILRETSRGVLVFPGPARIKLFARVARKFLGEAASGVPMNPFTRKIILPLSGEYVCETPVPLRAVYAIAAPRKGVRKQTIRIEPLSPREAFFELVKNTFNSRVVDAERLARQFVESAGLVGAAPVKRLSYPRDLDRLPAVREAVLCDLAGEYKGNAA